MENSIIKKPIIKLLYNSKDCSEDFSKYISSLSFQDFEDEQSDELTISLNDEDGYFSSLWYPEKGDKLTCNIIYGNDNFSCGVLTIDDNNFDFSTSGDRVEIKALATSINAPVRTKKVVNHTGKTLNEIASSIGKSHGFKVSGNSGDIKVGTIIQKNESDIAFLKRISREYGYIFNIKDGFLTFIKLEELENQDALFDIYKKDFSSLRLNDTSSKMYGKCKISYFDSKAKKLRTYTAQGNPQLSDTLVLHSRCQSLQEAQRKATSALKNAHKEIKGSISLNEPLNNFIAGVNFNIFNIGKFEGKYHIKTSKRNVDESGYRVEGDIELCI